MEMLMSTFLKLLQARCYLLPSQIDGERGGGGKREERLRERKGE
jgi:hypothetical protein